ncbi:MAG: ABC transporter substrate-binding protein [Planctomycetota bacterium]
MKNLGRIVSLSASTTAVIDALGATDRLVAVTKDCARLTPVVAGIPLVGDCWSASADEVAAFEPDLVVGAAPYRGEVVAALVERRLRFLATAPWTLSEVFTDMLTIGAALERHDEAFALVEGLRSRMEEIRRAVADRPRPRVYCEVWMKPVMSSPLWVSELVDAAGGEMVIEGARVLEPEEVVDADPDVVVMAWCGAIGRSDPAKFAARPGYGDLRAVREGRVVPVRDEYLNAPCQHLATGLEILAHTLHPEVFGDLPTALAPERVRRVDR